MLFAALAPAPVSSEAVSRPLITRVSTPTLKNEMNFSWASISWRAAAVDFGRQDVHRTLSQSSVSRPEKRQGRDASGVVLQREHLDMAVADLNVILVPCHGTLHDLAVNSDIATGAGPAPPNPQG